MRVKPPDTLFVIAVSVFFAGCDSDLAGGPEADNPHGVYSLLSIDGEALPLTDRPSRFEPGTPCTMVSGSLTVDIDDTAWAHEESECSLPHPEGGFIDWDEQSNGWFGTWSLAGNQITFETQAYGDDVHMGPVCIQTGTWSGSRITIAEDCTFGARLVYEFLRPLRL